MSFLNLYSENNLFHNCSKWTKRILIIKMSKLCY